MSITDLATRNNLISAVVIILIIGLIIYYIYNSIRKMIYNAHNEPILIKTIKNAKMGLNLSRGKPIKYYSSDRIVQIVGNGLVTLIDEKTQYRDFFNDNEMVFYNGVNDKIKKILKISRDEKLRKQIAKNGKAKYMKYFNSNIIADFIINKTLDLNNKRKYFWH